MSDIVVPQKLCSKCKRSFPLNSEHFSPDKTSKTGLRSYCRDCGTAMSMAYYERNRAKVLERLKQHRIDNPEIYAERERARYQNNPERERARWADYRARNRDKVLQATQEWRLRNADHIKAYSRRYHQEHLEQCRLKSRNYYRDHLEECLARARSYNASVRRPLEKAQGDGYTRDDIRLQYRSQHGKCWHCFKPVGKKFHVDHLIPLRKGGKHDASNIVIACPLCNLSKKDKLCYIWNGRLF
jgi:5-methylcytosine-specific restriction endonuclease McrA